MSTTIKTVQKKKLNLFYFHIAVTVFCMFGFGHLPPISTITPIGMKVLGIFLGLVYAWTTTSLIWPSLLGMLAVSVNVIMPLPEFFTVSFANNTVVFILFIFIFAAVLEEAGLLQFLAHWFTSRKIAYGRPWMFTFLFLFGAFLGGALVNEIASALIFWRIFYNIAKEYGFKPFEKYTTLMVFGIVFCSVTAGGSTLPFKLGPIVFFPVFEALTGTSINFFDYLLFGFPMGALTVVVYTLICRFVFRPDISALKSMNGDTLDKASLKLEKRQKVAFGFIAALMILLLGPDVLPKDWPVVQLIHQTGTAGVVIFLVILMFFIRFDGRPLMDFKRMANLGISWDIYVLFAMILPLSSLLTSDMTGIKPFLIQLMSPILVGRSPLLFTILVLLLGTIITNFANNVVLGIIFINIICPLAAPLGIDPAPIVTLMIFTIQLAYLTPAGSAPAAMVFGNTEWVKAKDIYYYAVIFSVILFVFYIVVGLPYAKLIF